MVCDFWSLGELRESGRSAAANRCRGEIVEKNMGLVIKIAAKYHKSTGVPIADLKQEGSIGLLKAIEGFNPALGMKFSSYAVPKIRGEILHYLRDRAPLMRVPRPYWDAYKAIEGNQKSLAKQGYILSLKSIALMKGFSEEKWREISNACSARMAEADFDFAAQKAEEGTDAGEVFGSLAALSEGSRSVFVAFAMGRSVEELAEQFDRTIEGIEEEIDRSRQILKTQLA